MYWCMHTHWDKQILLQCGHETQQKENGNEEYFFTTFPQAGDIADSEIYFLLVFSGHHSADFCAVLSICISRGLTFCLPEIYRDNASISCRVHVLWGSITFHVYTSILCQDMHCSCSKQPKYVFVNRDLRHYYGNLILSFRSKLFMLFSSRKLKILLLMAVCCAVVCFIMKILRDIHSTGSSQYSM